MALAENLSCWCGCRSQAGRGGPSSGAPCLAAPPGLDSEPVPVRCGSDNGACRPIPTGVAYVKAYVALDSAKLPRSSQA